MTLRKITAQRIASKGQISNQNINVVQEAEITLINIETSDDFKDILNRKYSLVRMLKSAVAIH